MFIGPESVGKGCLTECYTGAAYAPYDAEKANAVGVINLKRLVNPDGFNEDLIGYEYLVCNEASHPTGKGTTRDISSELKTLGDRTSIEINPKFLERFKAVDAMFVQLTAQFPTFHVEEGIRRRLFAFLFEAARRLSDGEWSMLFDIVQNPKTAELAHFAMRYFFEIMVPDGFFAYFIRPNDAITKSGIYTGGFYSQRLEAELDNPPADLETGDIARYPKDLGTWTLRADENGKALRDENGDMIRFPVENDPEYEAYLSSIRGKPLPSMRELINGGCTTTSRTEMTTVSSTSLDGKASLTCHSSRWEDSPRCSPLCSTRPQRR